MVDQNEDTIDHLITNSPQNIVANTVLKTGQSDHNILIFTVKTTNPPTHPRYFLSRNYKSVNWDQMKLGVSSDPQLVNACQSSDPHLICKSIQEVINRHLDFEAPLLKHQVKTKSPQFTTPPTRQLAERRNDSYRMARLTNDPEHWREYRHLRNQTHKAVTKDKKDFLKEKLNDENSSKDKWDTTKELLGWKKTAPPVIIVDKGKSITSQRDIANILNFKMLEKVSKTIARIQKTDTDPMSNYKKVYADKTCTFDIKTITMHELRQTIHKMKPSRTAGIDGISIKLIKELWKELEIPILQMVNSSIQTKQYPTTLKQSKIIPLLKQSTPPKPPTSPDSYRGINLLMSLGKILDKIVLKQTLEYLIQNTLVHHAHHGSIKGRSTTTAVITLMDTWSELVENGDEIAAISIGPIKCL